jgi:hypothetical protein
MRSWAPSKELKIATLMSVYPLEAGFGIYDELAGAPFFYRVNDILPVARRRALKGVAPAEVPAWLTEMQATAVMTGYVSGYDFDLEEGFARFARESGLIPLPVDLRGGYKQDRGSGMGLLWVAPSLVQIGGGAIRPGHECAGSTSGGACASCDG